MCFLPKDCVVTKRVFLTNVCPCVYVCTVHVVCVHVMCVCACNVCVYICGNVSGF